MNTKAWLLSWIRVSLLGFAILMVSACGGGGGEPPGNDVASPKSDFFATNPSEVPPRVVINGDGDAVIFWQKQQEDDYSVDALLASRFVKGEGWKDPEIVGYGFTGYSMNPRAHFDEQGNIYVVWISLEGDGQRRVKFNKYVMGSGWGGVPKNMSDHVEYSQSQYVAENNGEVIVTWAEDGVGGVWGNISNLEQGWVGAKQIYIPSYTYGLYPVLSVNKKNGNTVLTWSIDGGIFLSIKSANEWSEVKQAFDVKFYQIFGVRAIVLDNGDILLSWFGREKIGGDLSYMFCVFDAMNGCSDVRPVSNPANGLTGIAGLYGSAHDGVFAVYRDSGGLWFREFSIDDEEWSDPELIIAGTELEISLFDFRRKSDGSYIAAWLTGISGDGSYWVSTKSAGGEWASPIEIESNIGRIVSHPLLRILDDDSVLIAGLEYDREKSVRTVFGKIKYVK